jgi:hypothetical protein
MIKKFESFEHKTIAVYHGLGGRPAKDRIDLLKSFGYDNIIYPYINFEKEWDLDRCKSMFQRELENVKDADVIVGFSLGGYLAYLLAKHTGKDLVLVNPSLDRSKSLLRVKDFDVDDVSNLAFASGKMEVFFGENDTLIPKESQIDFLNENGINFTQYIIKGMEHRTPIDKFEEIINRSNIL